MEKNRRSSRPRIYCIIVPCFFSFLVAVMSEVFTGSLSSLYGALCCRYEGVAEGAVQLSRVEADIGRYGRRINRYHIEYSYSLADSVYRSSYVAHTLRTENVDEFLDLYPEGANVEVKYDRSRPERSVLQDGPISSGVYFQIILIVFVFPISYVIMRL